MNKLLKEYSNLPITSVLILTVALLILLAFKALGLSSAAFLSLVSAIIGGLIATSSQAWVSAQDRENQLRLAAIGRRLEAHQQAYALWRKLLASLGSEKNLSDTILECQSWWENNCLYLDAKARGAFVSAYLSAGSHKVIVLSKDINLIKENYQIIINAGNVIVAGVSLPTIGELENKAFEIDKNKKK